jgi:hypothetical protein
MARCAGYSRIGGTFARFGAGRLAAEAVNETAGRAGSARAPVARALKKTR